MKWNKHHKWRFRTSGVESRVRLFGVNIFNREWHDTGEHVIVYDPHYNQPHNFNVYTVTILGIQRKFAAGEFSNCVWGFYV